MRHALSAAGLALVAATTVGCGSDGPPTDASQEDFCQVFEDFEKAVADLGEDAENSDQIQALKDTGEELEEVGTPEDMTEQERAGFEVTVATIESIDAEASDEELNKLEEDYSAEEKEQTEAFNSYLGENCDFS